MKTAIVLAIALAAVPRANATGEAVKGFPNWAERVMLEWMNRARVAPQIEMSVCGAACGEGGCYSAQPPLAWASLANHSARFHSDEMVQQGYFQHDSACTLVQNISSLYPSSCNGAATCACVGGVKACSATCTTWDQRIGLFGTAAAGENISSYSDPNDAFYQWLYENNSSSSTCGYNANDAHRFNILDGSLSSISSVGTGVNASGPFVADFSRAAVGSKIVSGSHYPRQGSTVDAWANWYDSAGPLAAAVVVDGSPVTMTLMRGTAANGAWHAALSGYAAGCHRYYFQFTDSGSAVIRYPTTGTLGIGDTTCADWATWPVTDFNGDGHSDIVLQNTSGDVAEWQMNGSAIASGALVSTPGSSWRVVATGDFSGDGNADLLLQNNATGDVAEWQMNGMSITAGAVVNTPGTSWKVVAVGDVNGDSKSDIILQNISSGDVAVWLMNGFTVTSGAVIGTPGTSWNVIATGDFNADGKSDVLLQNNSNGNVAVWLLSGTSITGGGVAGGSATSWKAIGAGDLDGDGKSDVILQNTTTGDIAGWLMNGTAIASGSVIASPGTSWTVMGSADYSGDGRYDILLRNTSGNIAEWQMNGLTVSSGAVVGGPGTAWTPIVK